MLRWIVLSATHTLTLAIGFALGIYLLPILVAPPSPDQAMLSQSVQSARYQGEFKRDLRGSDFLHWGEGTVSISASSVAHQGRLAPGPDYKLYLVPQFIEDEAEFLAVRDAAQLIGDIKTFDGFLLDVPQTVDIDAYTTVLVWCETFGEFISAAKYR